MAAVIAAARRTDAITPYTIKRRRDEIDSAREEEECMIKREREKEQENRMNSKRQLGAEAISSIAKTGAVLGLETLPAQTVGRCGKNDGGRQPQRAVSPTADWDIEKTPRSGGVYSRRKDSCRLSLFVRENGPDRSFVHSRIWQCTRNATGQCVRRNGRLGKKMLAFV